MPKEGTEMQIVENWVQIIGIVIGILPADERPEFLELSVRVEEVRPVKDYASLLQAEPGDVITLLARTGQVEDRPHSMGLSLPFDARVRVAGPPPLTYFVHPDWRLPP